MVTELKLANTDTNYRREMEALVREDLAEHAKTMDESIAEKGEAGQRLAVPKPPVPQKPKEYGLDEKAPLDMHQILAGELGMEWIDLDDFPVTDYKVLRMVPADLARAYRVFPLAYDEASNTLTLAISDPSNVTIVDDLSVTLGYQIHALVAKEGDIVDRINQRYGLGDESIDTLLTDYGSEAEEDVLAADAASLINLSDDPVELAQSPPIKKLADLILLRAIRDRASDIHIEPFESSLRVRYRVDGQLRQMNSPPMTMHRGLVSRLKVMTRALDISETRRPQSGRIKLSLPDGRECDLRVETVPTVHGEAVAMRVLDKAMMQIGIHDLGMSQDALNIFLKEIRKPNGIILVSGPTGCGKTTTLYAAINEVKSPEDKLITTEDPVEYELDGIVQINVNDAAGLSFARCLRSILRQDPDIILVGEIRDVETAQISIQSALTGHLVFSTLHTNSAAGTITRLIDMGIEPFLVTSTLQACVGQRLVRTICSSCRKSYTPSEEELLDFGATLADVSDITFYHGEGCEECSFTGYRGRLGVFELLRVTEEVVDMILGHATTDEVHAMALKQGMVSLRQDGWMKICQGVTTLAEVASHTPREEVALPGGPPAVSAKKPPALETDQAPPTVAATRTAGLVPPIEEAMPVEDTHLPGLL